VISEDRVPFKGYPGDIPRSIDRSRYILQCCDALPTGSCLHTLYAFSDKNLDLTYNRVCWHVDLTVYLMRHLCVILSYIAQYSLLLPLYESSPCFSGSVASQLRIFGKGLYPLLPNTIPAYQLAPLLESLNVRDLSIDLGDGDSRYPST